MKPLRTRPRSRGFTLIELLVSLVAGLIVALAVVSLSKSVANQFYDEVRANAAETSIRLAGQRLRADISRAGLMTTGNIVADPRASRTPAGNAAKGNANLQQLSGIRIVTGGSLVPPTGLGLTGGAPVPADLTTLSAAQNPPLNPDSFAIYGNLTSGDEYFGSVDPSAPGGCGGKAIRLNLDDPSLLRILRDPAGVFLPAPQAQAALTQVFVPVTGSTFYARVTDTKGYYHYATTCAANPVTWDGVTAYVYLQNANATLTSMETGSQFGGVDGFETISVSPIQGAYWFVGRVLTGAIHSAAARALYENNANAALSTAKFDLYRAWIAADGTILNDSAEVVAEYAVDLKLGFTVDDPTQLDTAVSKMKVLGFGSAIADRNEYANRDLTVAAAAAVRGTIGPHRIRSVRYRLATRTAMADRDTALPPPPGSDFLYRYRVHPANPLFARARVTQGEVALVNQARMGY